MSFQSPGGGEGFTEMRRALLGALEVGEQQIRERGAELLRAAEEQARQITEDADRRAGEVEAQLSAVEQQIAEARARLAAIRVRAAGGRRPD